jgi:hypothetical protein
MTQTTFSVPLEVKPDSYSRLSALIEDMRAQEDTGKFGFPENFARLTRDVPVLHFMSMSVFPASEYDPMFILEANFDGEAGVFWGQLEAALGEQLRDVVRCCKRPLDQDGPLYDAVTGVGSRSPIAPYLETRTQKPSVFHHGNRGLSRDRILQEDSLFVATRREIDGSDAVGPCPYRGIPATEIHARLRTALLPAFPWLASPAPARISATEHFLDGLRLTGFAIALLLVLSIPGLALAPLLSTVSYVSITAALVIAAGLLIYLKREPLPGTRVDTSFRLTPVLLRNAGLLLGLLTAYVVVATLTLTPAVVVARWLLHVLGAGAPVALGDALRSVFADVLWGLLGIALSAAALLLWLRYLERRDSSHDAPKPDERAVREMIRREDWIAQNHMGSIVLIKPGVLRTIIIKAGHLGLGLLLRFKATDGYLGSMRTVHFAHWAFLNNGSRLLFFSNFDHSWDSYLDDFIEKAHVGLTLAWGCGVGFPQTRFLILDGASHGRQFKAWALASRTVTRFWYSAYRDLTVDQIERNNRVADGLRKPQLSSSEAAAWIQDL